MIRLPETIAARLRVAVACLLLGLVGGCATAYDRESEIPWNSPQPWEGTIMLPGLDNQ